MGAELRFRGQDRVLAEVARRQHGVVGRRQLEEAGLGRGAIRWRLGAGRLFRVGEGVYAVGYRPLTRRGLWMTAVLDSGPEAVLSHWSAAELWGIRRPTDRRIHMTSPCKSSATAGLVRHHSAPAADEVTVEDGIPVTTVPRTILDLAAVSSVEVVESAIREAEYLRLHDRLSLPQLIARHPGRRGTRKVRTALAHIEEEPSGWRRSPLEERFVPFLRRHRLPIPRLNAWIEVKGKRYQVDCLWPGTHQIVELDGWQGHGTKSAFKDDRARDRRLRVAGYSVTRISWSQLDDEPTAIAADLRALLR